YRESGAYGLGRANRSIGAAPSTRSVTSSPTSGANLAPCPEQGEQTTNGPRRSITKSSPGAQVYRQVVAERGSGSRPGSSSRTYARTRSRASGSTVKSRLPAVVTVPFRCSPTLISEPSGSAYISSDSGDEPCTIVGQAPGPRGAKKKTCCWVTVSGGSG